MVIVIQIIALVALLVVIVTVYLSSASAFIIWILSLLFVLVAISLGLALRGHLTPGRILVPTSLIAALTAIIYKSNGVHDTAVFGFPVVVLLGGMLAGRRGIWPYVFVCMGALTFIAYGEMNGLIETPYSANTGWDDVLIHTALLMASASILNLLMKQMEDNLVHAKRNEAALQLSEERFRVFMDTSPAYVVMKDTEGHYVYCNNKIEELFGKPSSEIIGKTEFDLFPHWEAEKFTASDHEVLASGKALTLEYSAHDPKGIMRDWWVFKFPMYSSTGRQYLGMQVLDITERKAAEKAVRRSEDIYRRAITTAGAVPYYLDHRTRTYMFMGEGILQMTGYTVSEMTPDLWKSLIQEGFPRGNLAHLSYKEADRLTDEDMSIPWECDYRILTRNGQTRWVSDTSVKGFNELGELVGVIGILQDITDRKLAEIEREKLIKDLETRNAELERCTYTVSHDLKSPLVTAQGFLGYLEQDAIAGRIDRVRQDSQRIKDATGKMQRLLAELLELSRIGRTMNQPEDAAFSEIVHEALKIVEGQIKNRGVNVTTLPAPPTVHGDKARLIEVVQNLVDNACKYMGAQTQPQIEIGHSMDQDGRYIFHVRDNGMGIEPQYHERIFGLFNKLDPQSEGTGIGLALVKRIVEVHGGRIWVESEGADKGSTFYFTLLEKPWTRP